MAESPGTALVVDESLSARDFLKNIVRDALPAWDVITARNADEAIERASHCRSLDVVLVDVTMRGRNGLSLASDLKLRHPGAHIGVVTPHDHPVVEHRAGQNGFVYLTRPIDEMKARAFLRPITSGGDTDRD